MRNWSILTLGLNPAYQRILLFDNVIVGQVNRASERRVAIGGKGQHAALACNSLKPGCCACAQFLGGDTGATLAAKMDEMQIPQITVKVETPTRICTTLLSAATNEMTELIDPSSTIPAPAVAELRQQVLTSLSQVRGVALCGTYPPGVDGSFYADVINKKRSAFVVLDGYRGIETALATKGVDLLKVNAHEIRSLTGVRDIDAAAVRCREEYSLPWVALTDGADRASLYGPDGIFHYDIPDIGAASNPIGAGDTCTGITMLNITDGLDAATAFRWGLAAASASCLHLEGATFTKEDMKRIFDQIHVSQA